MWSERLFHRIAGSRLLFPPCRTARTTTPLAARICRPLATMTPTFNKDDSKLMADLHALSKKSPKLVRSSQYPAPAQPETVISSWKMNEFKYYDIPSPFPTLARGLFTTEHSMDGESGDAKQYRIVARGYDKFFNIGEVPWTTVRDASFGQVLCLISILHSSGSRSSGTPPLHTPSRSSQTDALSSSPPSHLPNSLSRRSTPSGPSRTPHRATPRSARAGCCAISRLREKRRRSSHSGCGTTTGPPWPRSVSLAPITPSHVLTLKSSCATTPSKNTSCLTRPTKQDCICTASMSRQSYSKQCRHRSLMRSPKSGGSS